MLLVLLAVLAAALSEVATASILAAGSLEVCEEGAVLQCGAKFVVTVTVQNGATGTESVSGFRMDRVLDANGVEYDVLDEVRITLHKSAIALRYPLTYARDFNAKPREVVQTRDRSGASFNFLTNPCRDGEAMDGACGFVRDAANTPVPYSQGFCCRCGVGDYLSDNDAISRANLQCNAFSADLSQSAHCLRFSPLWYSAFELGAPRTEFTVTALVEHCVEGACTSTAFELSPSRVGHCLALPSLSADPAECSVVLALEGDLAPWEGTPSFESKFLLVPTVCDDFGVCGARLLESSDRWLLVDRAKTTDGRECDKIGVSFEAFYTQGARCASYRGTCLANQIDDLYDEDVARLAAGQAARSFVASFRQGGAFRPELDSAATAAAVFETTRFQQSIVTLQLVADRIRFQLKVAPAKIVRAWAPAFEALAVGGGWLFVEVQNTGTVSSAYTVDANCSAGLAPVLALPLSLAPGASQRVELALAATSMQGFAATCTVRVVDSLFRMQDSAAVNLTVLATEQDRGAQGGTLDPDAPVEDNGVGPEESGGASESCGDVCGFFDLPCIARTLCLERVLALAGSGLSLLLAAALVSRFPGFFCAPCKLASSALCAPSSSDTPRRKRRAPSARPADKDSAGSEGDNEAKPSDSKTPHVPDRVIAALLAHLAISVPPGPPHSRVDNVTSAASASPNGASSVASPPPAPVSTPASVPTSAPHTLVRAPVSSRQLPASLTPTLARGRFARAAAAVRSNHTPR